MTLGLSILGILTTLLGMAVVFPPDQPTWFGFVVIAVGLCAVGAAFSGPHLRSAAPWGVGTALCILGLVGLGTRNLNAGMAWATLAFGVVYLGMGAFHFLRRVVPAERRPRFLRHT
ncbi:hypothetical protein JY651_45400 [Pyxidicoccus parkwayensis]|uniref:Uncharacterized protein n=1 Tax=Pyxidicoccus parkwayensis TaxID=2813578 RepID=A0ABX7NV00_9BACT|nr:hypothetical protein [Pyxidicoccus parkwaysis]QSQ22288.1 hypothetical protein JY651_45400 [Pyxidicoccus parkwaysis]